LRRTSTSRILPSSSSYFASNLPAPEEDFRVHCPYLYFSAIPRSLGTTVILGEWGKKKKKKRGKKPTKKPHQNESSTLYEKRGQSQPIQNEPDHSTRTPNKQFSVQ